MADFHIQPSSLSGMIPIPPSKSHTMRALIFALMAHGTSRIRNYLPSPDTEAMLHAIELLGAKIKKNAHDLEIEGVNGRLHPAENVIDAGNSGQVLRFIAALAALLPTYTIFTGDHSIRHQRPISSLLNSLKHLGAFAESSRGDGFAPIIIKGPLRPGHAYLSGEDSQPVSALLMATSFLDGPTKISVSNPGEKPWIDLTLSWLKKFGGIVEHRNHEEYFVSGNMRFEGFDQMIPGDFSSAAFPLAAALITASELTISPLDMQDVQGDKKLILLLIDMGAKIEIDDQKKTVTIKRGSSLKGGRIDINPYIDALPIVAVLSCFSSDPVEIYNGAIARQKESDRIHSIAEELKKMGAKIEEKQDGLLIFPSPLKGACVNAYRDHRIGLALAIAAMGAEGETCIQGIECISKSYPDFFKTFKQAGAKIEESS